MAHDYIEFNVRAVPQEGLGVTPHTAMHMCSERCAAATKIYIRKLNVESVGYTHIFGIYI